MADFEIERPSVDVQAISPTYNVNTPSFTIEINGSTVGQRGEKGEKGDPGEPGAPNILSIGTVVSGDTARATIEGTTPNQILNLVLPQGADGQDGQDGINGVDGQDGRDGQDGEDGVDGVGIQSIVQTTTSTEDDGNNIVTVTLTDGTTSTFTVQNGSKGSTGETGAQGPAGTNGTDGAKGDKGDKGDTGVGVESIVQTTTSTESGGTNIITATLTDGTTSEFYIKNGEAGGGGGGGTSDYNDLTNKPSINNVTLTGNKTTSDLGIDIPTATSDLTNDSGYITGLVMLEYGTSTWQDFIDAYNSNKIVYCKVGGRMAFLAYVETSKVEFQYYRSLSSPTVSSQPDEVYVYSLTSAGVWSTTTRKASSTIAVGTGLSRSYTASSRTMTLSVDTSTMAQKSDLPTKVSDLTNDSGYITGYTETDPVFSSSAASGITSTDITNWNNKSDFSGSYNDLTNKPTIPTVNNATLTIQKNGTTVNTFTANASSNVTANITVPTQTSDLTNNSGYITASNVQEKLNFASVTTSSNEDIVSDAYMDGSSNTAYIDTNSIKYNDNQGNYTDLKNVIDGKQNVITSTNKLDYSLLSNTPTIPTVPTNVSAFTNDSGYITGITSSDIYNVLGYYPAAEPSIYTYSSIRQITSISDGTYISLMDDITNDRPIVISLGTTEYVNALGTNNGTTTSLWFITSDNTYTKITLTVSGTSVTVTTENIEIPTKTSDLTNDSNFAVTNADNNFSVGQTIAGETVVDSIRTKNMFDSSYINNQWVSYPSGSIVDAANANARRISCSSGDTFTLSATFGSSDSNNIIVMAFYNASGTLLNRYVATNSTTLTLTETAPSNTSYMYVGHYSNLPTTIQLETGSTSTTYAPYQNLDGTSQVITGSATVNNTYISNAENNAWEKIGKVVVYHFTLTVTGTWNYTTQFLSNLPKPISYTRFMALDSSNNEPIRVAIDTSGNAFNAWSSVTPSSGHIIEGLVTYITSE